MKIDEKMTELLHKEIDGVNTAEDSARLHEYLTADPEAAQTFVELRELSHALSSAPQLNPRIHLSARIMNTIRSLSARSVMTSSWRDRLRVFNLRPGFAFASGVALGCVLLVSYALVTTENGAGVENLFGTIVERSAFSNMRAVANATLATTGFSGSVGVQRSLDHIVVNVTLEAAEPAELRIFTEESQLRFKGYVDSKNTSSDATITATMVSFTVRGDHEIAVLYEAGEAPASQITVAVVRGSATIFSKTIELSEDTDRK